MFRNIGIVIVLLLSCNLINGQNAGGVAWYKGNRFSWDHFKGNAPINAVPAAVTASGISYNFYTDSKKGKLIVNYTVTAFFYPSESWYKPNLANDLILSHEQVHFDITELHARKMRKILSKMTFTKNVKEEIKTVYREINWALKAYQNNYDKETDFSRNSIEQKRWNTMIAEALE